MYSPTVSAVQECSTWSAINLREAVSGDYTGPEPTLLQRSDGKFLIYPGKLHSIAGSPGGGKSWIALVICAQMLGTGSVVLFIDFEDSADSVVGRLKILGVPDQVILDRFGYVSPSEPLPDGGARELDVWLDVADLVVIDGVTDAMTLNSWNPLDNKDVAMFIAYRRTNRSRQIARRRRGGVGMCHRCLMSGRDNVRSGEDEINKP